MRLGTDSSEVQAAVVGLRSLSLRNRWSGPVECLEVKLSPLGIFALSGRPPLDELTDHIVDFEALLGSSESALHNQFSSCHRWNARSALLRNLVNEEMTIDHGSAEVRQAWSMLSQSVGQAYVAGLCSATGWSAKRLRARSRNRFLFAGMRWCNVLERSRV